MTVNCKIVMRERRTYMNKMIRSKGYKGAKKKTE